MSLATIIPTEIVNHILSFRPTHPTARIIMEKKQEIIMSMDPLYFSGDETFMEMSSNLDGNQLFNVLFYDLLDGNDDPTGLFYPDEVVDDYGIILTSYGVVY
jgi:hypothetical protein